MLKLLRLIAIAMLLLTTNAATALSPNPASANDCGEYWATQGAIGTYRYNNLYMATYSFTLTRFQLDQLRCHESYLEINFELSGFHVPDEWDSYFIHETNLPGAIHDTALTDRDPDKTTPGVTAIPTASLNENTNYYATLGWLAGTYPTDIAMKPGDAQGVRISWQPVRFAPSYINPVETAFCELFLDSYGIPVCMFGGDVAAATYGPDLTGIPNGIATFPESGTTIRRFGGWDGIQREPYARFPYAGTSLPATPSPPAPIFPSALPASARSGQIVESSGGHLYVLAGGRLFYFDRNNAAQLNAFRAQGIRLVGNDGYLRLQQSSVHLIEVNRDSSGNYAPGSHMPADHTWLYELGSLQQYVIRFQWPFPVGSSQEVIDLGGQDKAIMVPPSIADLRQAPLTWVQNDLLQFWGNPNIWHNVDRGYYVPSVSIRDCLSNRWNRGVTLMPASAWNHFPTHPTQHAACDYTHGQWLYGSPSNRQVQVLYGAGHYVQYGEVAPLGGVDQARAVTDATIDSLLAQPLNLPNYHLFKAVNSPTVYMVQGNQFRLVGSPSVRDCLIATYSVVVESVPQSFIDRLPKGDGAQCPYEGRQLMHPQGRVDYVKNGQRHWVPNPTVRDCLIGRAGTGQPIAVPEPTWFSYSQGADAFCPYNRGANFVRENNNSTVWLVDPVTGIKRHVGTLCVPDPYTTQLHEYRVWVVPAGETVGYAIGGDWFATAPACQALPKP